MTAPPHPPATPRLPAGRGGRHSGGVTEEQVLLLDESGSAIGVAAKATVHHTDTPLHLAFSCYAFDRAGRFLLTRRALGKRTWPGVWTNSCCGHPAPDEPIAEAIGRRLTDELGLPGPHAPELLLPRFRYRTVMDDGVVENEMCPVYRVVVDGDPVLNPAEVEDTRWVPWQAFAESVLAGTRDVSPWCVLQVRELSALGPDPLTWSAGAAADLPPAAVR